jgi:hypothetical protein
MPEPLPKNPWIEWTELLIKLIATIIIPLVLFFASQLYTKAQLENQTKREYIKIGVSLLASEPNDKNIKTRLWAIELINHYSDVKLSPEVEKELERNKISLSFLNMTFKQEDEQLYEFTWKDDGSSGYELEIQKLVNGNWEPHNGICLTDNSSTMAIPTDTNVRWRHGSVNNGKTVFSKWNYVSPTN